MRDNLMSQHHHMNYLSPYARGLVYGLFYGFALALILEATSWFFWKLH